MYVVTKEFKFEAAHRIPNHPGKCKHLHGHSYKAVVAFEGEIDITTGMVLDFAVLSVTVGKWINDNWDHAFIHGNNDPIAVELPHDLKTRFYNMDEVPTAENMARHLFLKIEKMIPAKMGRLAGVQIWEQEDCCGAYINEEG